MDPSLRPDRLFGGMTRPATLFGLPIEVLAALATGSMLAFLLASVLSASVAWKIAALGGGGVLYGIARLICVRDPRAFRYIALQLMTKARHRTRWFWRSGSYSPMAHRRRRDADLGHKASLRNQSRTLESFVPYTTHVDRHTLRTVGGHSLTVLRIEGIAHESADDAQVQAWHDALTGLIRNIAADDVALWIHLIRQERSEYPSGDFEPGFAAGLDQHYRASLQGINLMVNAHYLTLMVRAVPDRSHWLTARREERLAGIRERIRDAQERLDQLTDIVLAGLARYGARRLGTYVANDIVYSEPLEFLSQLLNGQRHPIAVPKGRASYALLTSRLSFGLEQLEIRGVASRQIGAMLAVRHYDIERTAPGHLNILLTLPFPFVLTQSFATYGRTKAMAALRLQLRRLEGAEDSAESQIADLRQALDDVASSRAAFGEHHLSVFVPADSARQLNERISTAQAALIEAGFAVVREDECIEAAFFAQLPGNFRMRPRPSPISSSNLIAFTGFHNYPTGLYDGNQWGPAITLLKTTSGTPFYFNFHLPPGIRRKAMTRAEVS